MKYRDFGRTGWKVSSVSFGAWAIGGTWGTVKDDDSMQALNAALDAGINLFDTADVYGDGRSERLLGQLRKERPSDDFHIITKAGRRLPTQTPEGYSRSSLTSWINRSLENIGTDSLELVQLHCPPMQVYYMPEVFGILDDFVQEGKIQHYGVSVEKVEMALKALEYSQVQSVQIIFNMFRQRPADLFFAQALKKKVGILARVPLSSGMLSGKMSLKSSFEEDDHRMFNRQGKAFDRAETFSGVDFKTGLEAVEEFKTLLPEGWTMAQFALRWILMHEAVSCVIPGAKNEHQVNDNAASADLPAIAPEVMQKIAAIYAKHIKPLVHQYW